MFLTSLFSGGRRTLSRNLAFIRSIFWIRPAGVYFSALCRTESRRYAADLFGEQSSGYLQTENLIKERLNGSERHVAFSFEKRRHGRNVSPKQTALDNIIGQWRNDYLIGQRVKILSGTMLSDNIKLFGQSNLLNHIPFIQWYQPGSILVFEGVFVAFVNLLWGKWCTTVLLMPRLTALLAFHLTAYRRANPAYSGQTKAA